MHTFSAKEKDAETGYSYFGARYYSSDLSVWLSVDPMADKYPSMSPYSYCANNPIKLIDPNGEDWYESDDGKTLEFVYGESGQRAGYTNIGQQLSLKYRQKLKNGDYSTLTISANLSESEFVSQYNSDGNRIMECADAAKIMCAKRGGKKKTSSANDITVSNHNEKGRATTAKKSNFIAGLDKTVQSLLKGIPVMAGMDYKDGSPNADGVTDHYVVITSVTFNLSKSESGNLIYTGGNLQYANPGRVIAKDGIDPSNKFTFSTKDYKATNGHRVLTSLRVL